MRYYFLRSRTIRHGLFWLGLVLFSFVGTLGWRGLTRRLYGVKPGVYLEGRPVGGLLKEELRRVVEEMAVFYSRPPQDAMVFPETGEVIPEKTGRVVDVERTVTSVIQAGPGTRTHLVFRPVAPAVTADLFTPLVRGPEDRAEVALTFNVAWGEECLPAILAVLKKEKAPATFFFVGDWVKKFPDLTRAVAEAGHEIANHGLNHEYPTRLSREALVRLIEENAALLQEVTGRPAARLFAPPYGDFNRETVAVAAGLGYHTVLWTVDTVDWKRPAPDIIIRRVKERVTNGAIILMHPTAPTVAALPEIIRDLKARGFRLVTVGEMLRKR